MNASRTLILVFNCRITAQKMKFSGVFIVNFEHIPRLFSSVSIVDFEQVKVSWI